MADFKGSCWAGREALCPFRDPLEKRPGALSGARIATPALTHETTGSHKPVVPVAVLSTRPALPRAGTAVLRLAAPGTTDSLAEWGGGEGNTPSTSFGGRDTVTQLMAEEMLR